MADDWELAHNLIVGVDDATLDPDGDGMSNIRQFQAGTDPQDPASFLKFDTISPDIGGVVNISFFAVAGKTYRVLYTDTLTTATWHSLTNFIANRSDRVVTFQDSSRANGTERYYRLADPGRTLNYYLGPSVLAESPLGMFHPVPRWVFRRKHESGKAP